MINILYHSLIIGLMISSVILWGFITLCVVLMILILTANSVDDEYKPTIIISLVISAVLSFFVTERKEQFENIPTQVCETHIRVVDTITRNITYNKNGMLLVHYDTNKITNNSTLDTVKTNCTYISE